MWQGTRAKAWEGHREDLIFLELFRFSCIFDVSGLLYIDFFIVLSKFIHFKGCWHWYSSFYVLKVWLRLVWLNLCTYSYD